jgi:hypothetical protein
LKKGKVRGKFNPNWANTMEGLRAKTIAMVPPYKISF